MARIHLAPLCAALLACRASPPESSQVAGTPLVEGWIDVPGGKLHFDELGSGPPLVLVHDGLLPSTTWDGQLADFARRFRVVRYDRRGNGRSPASETPWSDVDDLAAVLEARGIERASLVGCSYGGSLCLDFALAHPERVDALVLVGPIVSGYGFSPHFRERGAANARPLWMRGDLAGTIERWVDDPYLVDPANTAARRAFRARLEANTVALAGAGPEPLPPARPALGHLAEIHAPTLIVVGASDIPDVHAHTGVIEAGLPRATRVVVPRAGHLVHLERPDVFDPLVLDFLDPAGRAAELLEHGPRAAPAALFGADPALALDVEERGRETRGAHTLVDLTYASPQGGRVTAWLVLPGTGAPGPGVLFLHPGQGDRSTFLDEALELAGSGVVSLLIDAPFARPAPWAPPQTIFDAQADQAQDRQTIQDLARGIELLASRPEVDPARLGYVGHSLGATLGGLLLALEPRIRASVLMAGLPALTFSYVHEPKRGGAAFHALLSEDEQRAYVDALAPFDALCHVGRRPPRPLLFQFAWRDEFISRLDAALYEQAAGEPHETRWYETDHFFDATARAERDAWLLRALAAP